MTEPVAGYLAPLMAEITSVGGRLPARHAVSHIHWGGGSPSILSAADIERLAAHLRGTLRVADDAEFAVEIDPRNLTAEQVKAFASLE